MQLDTFLDIADQSCECVAPYLEEAIKFLGTKRGRITLLFTKLWGLFTEIYALNSANNAISICCGISIHSGLFECYLTIFLYERIVLFYLVWKYGYKPTNEYEQYALQEIKEEEEEKEKDKKNKEYEAPSYDETATNPSKCTNNNESGSEPTDLSYVQQQENKIIHYKPTEASMNAPRPMEMEINTADDVQKGLLINNENNNNNNYNINRLSDNRKLEGIRSLWYGSLFNASDYIGMLWKCGKFPQVKCIMCWYIFTIHFLFAMSISVMAATSAQFSLESVSSEMDQAEGNSSDNQVSFGPFDAAMLFMSLVSTQYGIFQQTVAFGATLSDKIKHTRFGCTTTCIRRTIYLIALATFIQMIFSIISLISTLSFISKLNQQINGDTDTNTANSDTDIFGMDSDTF